MVTATTTTTPPTKWSPNSSSSRSNCSNTSNHHNLGGTITTTTPMTTHAHFLVVPWTVSTWPTRPSDFLPTEVIALLSDRTDVHDPPPQRPRSQSVGSSSTTSNTRNYNITIPATTTPFLSSLYVPSLFSSMTVFSSGRTKRLKQCTTSYKDTMAVALDPHPRYRVFL
jgi:hypothetical protein